MAHTQTIEPVRLTDQQLVRYDMDFIDDELFASITGCIDAQLGPEFSFVDVGGGIGGFTDRLLAAYPGARGVVLDNAPALLDKNERSDRKTLVLAGAEELDRIFGAERFDIVFMDCHMPEMDGFEATAKIRALEEGTGRRTPIIAMTADARIEDRAACLAAGMDDYVSKPASLGAIGALLKRWLPNVATPTQGSKA